DGLLGDGCVEPLRVADGLLLVRGLAYPVLQFAHGWCGHGRSPLCAPTPKAPGAEATGGNGVRVCDLWYYSSTTASTAASFRYSGRPDVGAVQDISVSWFCWSRVVFTDSASMSKVCPEARK